MAFCIVDNTCADIPIHVLTLWTDTWKVVYREILMLIKFSICWQMELIVF